MKPGPASHDRELFEVLVGMAELLRPGVRRGAMFGCPAVFVGRKMAVCVYGAGLGLKVPEAVAIAAKAAERAAAFQPYGKSAMREWIEVAPEGRELGAYQDLIQAALDYAALAG